MMGRCLIFALLIEIARTQNPCRVNVVFGIDASSYVNTESEAAVFNELSNVQNAYRSWTISLNSVRATIPRPMGCSQGGNWTLQNDLTSLENVAKTVSRFVYTCFQQSTLSAYFDAFNREILQYQPVDQGVNYVFVLFTATTDTNDVQQAISLRQKYFDPYGYGVIILRIKAPTASNLIQLQTYGLYDLGDPTFTQDITKSVCSGKKPLPTTIPQIYTRETTQEATTIELESTTV